MPADPTAVICDGCGAPADAVHLRRRVERLERATRFRPIHIQTLLLNLSPLALDEDDFYGMQSISAASSRGSRDFFRAVLTGCGIAAPSDKSGEALLADFQRAGFFLADWVECPLEEIVLTDPARLSDSVSRRAATVVARLRFSYKPQRVILLSRTLEPMVPVLERADLTAKILFAGDGPGASPGSESSYEYLACSLERIVRAARDSSARTA